MHSAYYPYSRPHYGENLFTISSTSTSINESNAKNEQVSKYDGGDDDDDDDDNDSDEDKYFDNSEENVTNEKTKLVETKKSSGFLNVMKNQNKFKLPKQFIVSNKKNKREKIKFLEAKRSDGFFDLIENQYKTITIQNPVCSDTTMIINYNENSNENENNSSKNCVEINSQSSICSDACYNNQLVDKSRCGDPPTCCRICCEPILIFDPCITTALNPYIVKILLIVFLAFLFFTALTVTLFATESRVVKENDKNERFLIIFGLLYE